jgi:hypothetical protein
MKTLSHFVGTTILGGVLFLTPIVVLAFVFSKAFEFVSRGLTRLRGFAFGQADFAVFRGT